MIKTEDSLEASFAWPRGVSLDFVRPRPSLPSRVFGVALAVLRVFRRECTWITFFKEGQGSNSLASFPSVVEALEGLFRVELGSSFSDAQRALLLEADIVLVGVDRQTQLVVSYVSVSLTEAGHIASCRLPGLFGGHCLVASRHQQRMLGVLSIACACIYGQSLRSLFREMVMVTRTNNRHLYRVFSKAGHLYRSDELNEIPLSDSQAQARAAIQHMHDRVFRLNEAPLRFDRALQVEHSFDPRHTIPGLGEHEIVYLCLITSMFRFVLGLVTRRPRQTGSPNSTK